MAVAPSPSVAAMWHDLKAAGLRDPVTTVLYSLLLLYAVYSFALYIGIGHVLWSLPDLLWDLIVYIIPSSFILAFERRPSSQSAAGVRSQESYLTSRTFAAKRRALEQITGLRSNTSIAEGKPAGLYNIANSCFQNSIIQALASLRSLEAFLDFTHTHGHQHNKNSFASTLKKFLSEMNDPDNSQRSFSVPRLLTKLNTFQQQDAHEYYSKIIDTIESEINAFLKTLDVRKPFGHKDATSSNLDTTALASEPKERALTAIEQNLTHPFEGLLAQRLGCLSCGYVEGITLIPFSNLTLNLSGFGATHLTQCLDDYTTLDATLEGVHCNKCTLKDTQARLETLLRTMINKEQISSIEQELRQDIEKRIETVRLALEHGDFSDEAVKNTCKIKGEHFTKVNKSKQQVLARYPTVLALHINRSRFDGNWGTMVKNSAAVSFPMYLDASRWAIGEDWPKESRWNVDPHRSMLDRTLEENERIRRDGEGIFVLRSVVQHAGTHNDGHYVAFRQTPFQHVTEAEAETKKESRKWWCISDTRIYPSNKEAVINQGNVFMLFYERLSETELEEFRASVPVSNIAKTEEPVSSVEISESTSLPATPVRTIPVVVSTPTPQLIPKRTTSLSVASPIFTLQNQEANAVKNEGAAPEIGNISISKTGGEKKKYGLSTQASAITASPPDAADPSTGRDKRDSVLSQLGAAAPPVIPMRAASLSLKSGRSSGSASPAQRSRLSSHVVAVQPDRTKAT